MRKKSNKFLIIKCSNNPIVDVLRPAQKLQVWNTYIPDEPNKMPHYMALCQKFSKVTVSWLLNNLYFGTC